LCLREGNAGFFPAAVMKTISIENAMPEMIIARDVSISEDDHLAIVYENTKLTGPMIERLKSYGIKRVTVFEEGETNNVPAREDTKKEEVFIDKPAPIIEEKLKSEAIENIEELFNIAKFGEQAHKSSMQVVKHIDSVVRQLISSVNGDKNAFVNIADLKSYDEYTYHHSLSVAVLSIAIGEKIGIKGRKLEALGKASIMHDIGKTAVPIEIINKPSKLTEGEFEIIKKHSLEGFNYLSNNSIGSQEMWQEVLLHHEKVDGTGYPLGIKGDKIPLVSRIISIADVYDALTSNRPYRQPMQPAEALEYIMANTGTHFDYDLVKLFIDSLELYPVGSIVELSNNKAAVVKSNEYAMRPVVQMLDTGKTLDLYNDYKYLSLTIKRLLSDA